MRTATFATFVACAATTTLASEQQTVELSASGSNSVTPLHFVDVESGKLLATSGSKTAAAPITLSNGLLSSASYTASLDGGLVTFTKSDAVHMPGNITINGRGIVAKDGHVQDWYLCDVGETQALAYGNDVSLNCEEVTLFAEPEGAAYETITIKAFPSTEEPLMIWGNAYPAPRQADMGRFWSGLAKTIFSLVGTMGLGGVVAYRGLDEKKGSRSVQFAK